VVLQVIANGVRSVYSCGNNPNPADYTSNW